jgi:hypothetical protein
VRFFLTRNPGYREGDELVCLAELAAANMRSLAARGLREGERAGAAARLLAADPGDARDPGGAAAGPGAAAGDPAAQPALAAVP